MKHGMLVAIAGVGLLAARVPLAAHHSTPAVYDISRVVTLRGVVAEVKMTNPHGRLSLDVKDATGNAVGWLIELPSATSLSMKALGPGRLKQGDEVTVDVWVHKSDTGKAVARMVHLPDGRVLSMVTGFDCASATQEGCAGPGRPLAPKQ